MTREEKIKLAIEKGITGDPITGKVYGFRGKEIIRKGGDGYIIIGIIVDKKIHNIRAHQFIYYLYHGAVVDCIDHVNGDRRDNRIDNLRSVTNQENNWNQLKAKGYSFNKKLNKYQSQIRVNDKLIHLGVFEKEQEARQAYLEAKKRYHVIM